MVVGGKSGVTTVYRFNKEKKLQAELVVSILKDNETN